MRAPPPRYFLGKIYVAFDESAAIKWLRKAGCTNRTLNYNYTAMSRSRSLRTLYILKNVKLSKKLFNDPASDSTDEK